MIHLRHLWRRYATLILLVLAGCGGVVGPPLTATPYPTPTPYPPFTPQPVEAVYLEAVDAWIKQDDSLSPEGRAAVVALYGQRPTFVFPENQGNVLQFNVDGVPESGSEIKKTAVLLIGTGALKAMEYGVRLDGAEVVFYTDKAEPWLALASTPPWGAEQLQLRPLAPEYVERLEEMGLITPAPAPVY